MSFVWIKDTFAEDDSIQIALFSCLPEEAITSTAGPKRFHRLLRAVKVVGAVVWVASFCGC